MFNDPAALRLLSQRCCDAGCAPDAALARDLWQNFGRHVGAPEKFAYSLDGAMFAVPDGHDWSLYTDACGSSVAGCTPASPDGCGMADHHAASPVLALLAAALDAGQ